MANAEHFRKWTKAILVGQPIGEKPNSYQEAREMILPNSRWIARYSIPFYRFVRGEENLIRPDKEITETWTDFQTGRDPVMDWVLRTTSDKKSEVNLFRKRAFSPLLGACGDKHNQPLSFQ